MSKLPVEFLVAWSDGTWSVETRDFPKEIIDRYNGPDSANVEREMVCDFLLDVKLERKYSGAYLYNVPYDF